MPLGDPVLPNYAVDLLVSRIADLTRTDAALVTTILDLTAKPLKSDQQRVILAEVIASLDSPKTLIAGIDLIDDSAPQQLPRKFDMPSKIDIPRKTPAQDS